MELVLIKKSVAFHILLCDSDIYSPNITIYDKDYDVFSGFKLITILFRVNGTGTISQQRINSLDRQTARRNLPDSMVVLTSSWIPGP